MQFLCIFGNRKYALDIEHKTYDGKLFDILMELNVIILRIMNIKELHLMMLILKTIKNIIWQYIYSTLYKKGDFIVELINFVRTNDVSMKLFWNQIKH